MKRKRDGSFFFVSLVFTSMLIIQALCTGPVAHGSEDKNLPLRDISVFLDSTGIVVYQGDDISIDMTVDNRGRQDEDIELRVLSIPKGWKAWVKTFNYQVTGVHVAGDESRSLTFKAEPDATVTPGKYSFLIRGQTKDKKLTSSSRITVTLNTRDEGKESKGIDITTSYPELHGPSGGMFEFSLEVTNESNKDTTFNLGYQAPKNWDVQFKPAYEEKYISSLIMKAGTSQSVAVEVKPYPWAEAGSHPVKVKINSPEAEAEADLTVVLTGSYELEALTVDGLLSLSAYKGKTSNLSFYVKNTGSATHNTVTFMSFKPENWKVDFSPERIEGLAPGDLKQVEVTITPADQALVGDYSVSLSIEGERVTKNIELRVTVKASAAWAWIGIGIIVLVIAGLVFLFIRLGRR
ncbi:MAG: NEW3 domain-containing protein [Thermodesulfobacteriota bacterium]|nr:NEW3 domain-containing protein [Thermodesulfobacteriota bacterium]